MNVKPGMKAAVDLSSCMGEAVAGKENHGIVVIVNELKPPGDKRRCTASDPESPEWVVTSISRPFTQFEFFRFGRYVGIEKGPSVWTAVIEDKFLRPIVEDKEPEKISEKVEA